MHELVRKEYWGYAKDEKLSGEDLIAEKFALSATLLAMMAAAACTVLLIVPVPFVTVTVPPVVAFKPVPAFV